MSPVRLPACDPDVPAVSILEFGLRFYREISVLRAITFDLDDTLYDNRPVIRRAESELVRFVGIRAGSARSLCEDDYRRLHADVSRCEGGECYDLNRLRWSSIKRLVLFSRKPWDPRLTSIEVEAMRIFLHWRSNVTISPENCALLEKLSALYPLAAITNGNLDLSACDFGKYFSCILRAGTDGRPKPFCDLYRRASEKLGVPLRYILHVGDDLCADVFGSLSCGMQSCWLNRSGAAQVRGALFTPHVMVRKLSSLGVLADLVSGRSNGLFTTRRTDFPLFSDV